MSEAPVQTSPSFALALRCLVIFLVLLSAAEVILRAVDGLHAVVHSGLLALDASSRAINIAASVLVSALGLLGLLGLFIVFEWRQLRFSNFGERYRRGIVFSLAALSISIAIQMAVFSVLDYWQVSPLFSREAFGPVLLLFPLIYLLLLGFLEYWLHRALHHYTFLWRFHAVHHQIEHLNAASSYSHFGEKCIYLLVITVPLALLLEAPHTHIALVTTFYIVSNYYMHSDSPSLSLPAPLRHVFADNVYHHYHHVRDARYFGKNYASFLSFYDRLFGTQHMPTDNTFPPTGVEGYAPITTLSDYIQRPFRKNEAR